ncbi:MAG: tetratricopeptide repeat protein [Sphingomonadales bacterium]|nr:MAG: tetratricopeptide repeat protein [Sphingomonadales bacterium]
MTQERHAMRTVLLFAAAPLLLAALPASANDRSIPAAIAMGAYDQAEQAIRAELRIYRDRPELLLNLATVYAKTNRAEAARALYAKVLAQPDVLMDVSETAVAGSHAIAQAGLRRIQAVQLSAR